MIVFFFQAEDGIRDVAVTGVQTCALPISRILGGTLAFNYQKPFAALTIDLFKGLSYKTTWNYYGYNLKTPADLPGLQPIGSEGFNGSSATFAARYTF